MQDEIRTEDIDGYAEIFTAIEDLVEASPHPRLASAAVLNAALVVGWNSLGGEDLTAKLAEAMQRIADLGEQELGRLQ